MQTVNERNLSFLKEILSGKSYADCAREYNTSPTTIGTAVRFALQLLKEHTDLDIDISAKQDYLLANKALISSYLDHPLPKTSISYQAQAYLKQHYGKFYVRQAKDIAANWQTIKEAFSRSHDKRTLQSIQKWLASEGYLVGDLVTDSMLDFAFETVKHALNQLTAKHGEHSFKIKKAERAQYHPSRLIVEAEISEGTHQVLRRFNFELLSY